MAQILSAQLQDDALARIASFLYYATRANEGQVEARVQFIWDLEDDPDGNYWHICVEGHGITLDEVEEVVAADHETATRSRSSGQPEAFGWTATGKYITVVFEHVTDDPLTVYPITAYEVPPPRTNKTRKKR